MQDCSPTVNELPCKNRALFFLEVSVAQLNWHWPGVLIFNCKQVFFVVAETKNNDLILQRKMKKTVKYLWWSFLWEVFNFLGYWLFTWKALS